MMKQLTCRSVSTNIAGFLFLLLILQLRPTMSEEVEDEREFDYLKNSSKGPGHWGELHEEWAACNNGHMQSPIDLLHERVQVVQELGKIKRNYRTANATLKNRGHDIMLQWVGDAGSIHINGTEYKLQQCHWHSPSDVSAMELHMVHESSNGSFAVIGILYRIGRSEPFLSELEEEIQALADTHNETTIGMVNPKRIKMGGRKYYIYLGSLTTPPCVKVRTASVEQVKLLRNAVHDDSVKNIDANIIRPTANFHPSLWGDRFITYTPSVMMNDACLQQVEELKEDVRKMLVADANESLKKLSLINSLKRLGIAYHFEGEIDEALEQMYKSPYGFEGNDLDTVALWFRLLRQQGYNVSCDVFNIFKDSEGNFKDHLINDVSGMLCLYEATHLRIYGEDILDEALKFTTTELKSIVAGLKPPLATQVMHALKYPLHKGMERIEARHYISVYQEDETKNETLLKLAKLDFNILQSIHQQELSQLSIWWKELDFGSKLPYARDRLVECYFWIVGIYLEPRFGLARKFLTKIIVMLSILDDTYDAYGTIEELQLFTDASERWELGSIDGLPEYMKVLYSELLNVFYEMEEELRNEGQSYKVNYAKEAMKIYIRALFVEAKWFNDGYFPTFEEYMQIAVITAGNIILTVASMVGMGDVVTRETLDWAINEPGVLKAVDTIVRLMDDIQSHKFEQERGHICSAVEAYMKQYDVSEQEANDELMTRVTDAWKDLNQVCMKPTPQPMPVMLGYLNFARMSDLIYKDKDGYTLAHEVMEEFITQLFIDHIRL